ERTGDNASLRDAIEHYRAALEAYAQQDAPLDVALTHSNLGQALRVLGEHEGDSDMLAGAVTSCRSALQVYTRDASPLEWAMASTNLANALVALAATNSGVEHLEEA